MNKIPIFNAVKTIDLYELIRNCEPIWGKQIDVSQLRTDMIEMVDHYKKNKQLKPTNLINKLMCQWYHSLESKNPCFSVYEHPQTGLMARP